MKLLCICHANICRSFMAQEFFKQLLPHVTVFSRGLYADPSYSVPSKVIFALNAHHIIYTRHQPTPLSAADLEQADLIFCMEQAHEETLLDRYAQYTDKIWLLTEYAYGKAKDIEDPISYNERDFEKSADKLFQACQVAAKRIEQDFPSQK